METQNGLEQQNVKVTESDSDSNKKNNPFGLSEDELRVLKCWRKGMTKADAYRYVMVSEQDERIVNKEAMKKRIKRFYDTYRIRQAMAATPGKRGQEAKKEFEEWKSKHNGEVISEFLGQQGVKVQRLISEKMNSPVTRTETNPVVSNNPPEPSLSQTEQFDNELEIGDKRLSKIERDKIDWLNSLNVSADPSALTIYGTGQYLISVAVKEISARQKAIKKDGISVLAANGRGSALTPTIISALKTAAAMILPFAPAPSAEDRRQMSKAAVLLGLLPDNIQENPDDYTAPIPATIDVSEDA